MKTETIQVLRDPADKQKTRSLYQMVFSDSGFYTDYYYRDKCADNVILTKTETDGEKQTLLSMLHLNPYELFVCGKTAPGFMIGAVATLPSRRHEGHMRDLLQAAFAYLGEGHIPFCFLVPVDEAIYMPFGFETICPLSEGERQADADVYCVQNEAYLHRRRQEEEIERMEEEAGMVPERELPACPVVMARITCPEAFDTLLGLRFETDRQRLAFLREKKIFFCDEL